jgi:sugar phosphate isomerase/epimerase
LLLLGIEALHPMFCADRCAISRLGEAVDLALTFPADAVGVVVDTYHVWWDSQLAADIDRASGRIVSYQLCDWTLPLPRDTLLGRGGSASPSCWADAVAKLRRSAATAQHPSACDHWLWWLSLCGFDSPMAVRLTGLAGRVMLFARLIRRPGSS